MKRNTLPALTLLALSLHVFFTAVRANENLAHFCLGLTFAFVLLSLLGTERLSALKARLFKGKAA